jgi:DNA polymerase III sliding clamp (beta) subunit (PCNA family)
LSKAVKRASVLADRKNNCIGLHFIGESCFVEAESYDKGRYQEEIPAGNPGGYEFKLHLNYRLLQACVKACSGSVIQFNANGYAQPITLHSPEESDFCLLMPIKLTEYNDCEADSENWMEAAKQRARQRARSEELVAA